MVKRGDVVGFTCRAALEIPEEMDGLYPFSPQLDDWPIGENVHVGKRSIGLVLEVATIRLRNDDAGRKSTRAKVLFPEGLCWVEDLRYLRRIA